MALVSCYCYSGSIRAFSLREADKLLQDGAGSQDLQHLGGITRLVGMVYDRENKDIILVGKTREDLPAITIDDLAVALRCRLLSDKYPCVSIDMTEETAQTGMQDVRFVGGIEHTQFGSDFLQSDVILKRYSLDLLKSINGVVPYLKQYEADVVNTMEINGKSVEDVKWYNEADSKNKVQEYKGKNSLPGKTSQSRFWFHVIEDESGIVEQDGVYVIEELRLGVRAETLRNSENDGKDIQAADISAEEFSRQFTASYNEVCQANPLLKRLKAMFDLVCIAEGVAHLGNDRPDLNYLLGQYTITAAQTPEKYKLVHRVGEFKCEGGNVVLSQLSGGITLEAVLMALEDGDVSGLKIAVLGSRPDKETLCWDLPLDQWKMPNNQPQEEPSSNSTPPQKLDVEFPGFSMLAQNVYFPKDTTGLETSEFTGFKPPVAMPPLQQNNPQLQKHTRLTISSENSKLQKALLSGDWNQLNKLLENVTVKTSDPILRFINAHACLATNRNNESLNMFLSLRTEELEQLNEWTYELINTTTKKQIPFYLYGDVLVRNGNIKTAINFFDKASSVNEDNSRPLALNAKGVALTRIGSVDDALVVFMEASVNSTNIADIYANLGSLAIQQNEGPTGALEDFNKAIELSPDFALAYYGRACIYLLLGKLQEAEQDFQKCLSVDDYSKDVMLALINNVRLKGANNVGFFQIANSEITPSFAVDTAIRSMENNDLGFMGSKYKKGLEQATIAYANGDSSQLRRFEAATTKYLNNNPGHNSYISKYNTQVNQKIATVELTDKIVSQQDYGWTIGASAKTSDKLKSLGLGANYNNSISTTYDISKTHNIASKSRAGIGQLNSRLEQQVSGYSAQPKGFETIPTDANIDEGDWNFHAVYGLLYGETVNILQ